MILRSSSGTDIQVRAAFPQDWIPPASYGGLGSGQNVDQNTAAGIPAVNLAIVHISQTVASAEMYVYDVSKGDKTVAGDTWQYKLLHDYPSTTVTTFNFYADITACLLGWGNSYIQKLKDNRGKVAELCVLNPSRISPRLLPTGEVEYTFRGDSKTVKLTSSDLIHVRGNTLGGGYIGLSPIQQHKNAIGGLLAVERYSSSFFLNSATPSGFIKLPNAVNEAQAQGVAQSWKSAHQGAANAHGVAVFGEGAEFVPISINPEDSQLIQTWGLKLADVARIFNIPLSELGVFDENVKVMKAEDRRTEFLQRTIHPHLERIEDAFTADLDLFGPASQFRAEFNASTLLRIDQATRYQAYTLALQNGWMTKNEVRAKEGLPPMQGGDTLLPVPVGAGIPDALLPLPETPALEEDVATGP